MLVLRPVTLMANWADVGALESFLAHTGRPLRHARRADHRARRRLPIRSRRRRAMPRNLPPPRLVVQLVVLPGFGHMLHHDAADQVAAAVEEISTQSVAK